MRKLLKIKYLVFSLLVIGFASFSEANMMKGSVGGGGHKGYGFVAQADGQVTITVIYDSNSADLDLIAGTSVQGQTFVLGMSTSSQKNYERLEFSVQQGTVVAFLVKSYGGSSPFHIYVNTAEDQRTIAASAVEIRSDAVTAEMERQLKIVKK